MTKSRTPLSFMVSCLVFLVIGACSGQPDAPPSTTASATTADTTSSAPAFAYTADDARRLVMLGETRIPGDLRIGVSRGVGSLALCENQSAYTPAEARSWSSFIEAGPNLPGVDSADSEEDELSSTLATAIILDDLPVAKAATDERIAAWADCRSGDITHRPVDVEVPEAATTTGYRSDRGVGEGNRRYGALTAARVENVLLLCQMYSANASVATDAARACVQSMGAGAAGLRGSPRPDVASAELLLTGVAGRRWDTDLGRAASAPCPKNDRLFLRESMPGIGVAQRSAGVEPGEATPDNTANIGRMAAEVATSPAAAAKRIVALRRLLARCTGNFTSGSGDYTFPSKVLDVTPNQLGDGGVTITYETDFGGARPEVTTEAMFRTGPMLGHVMTFGSSTPDEAKKRATTLADALIRAVG